MSYFLGVKISGFVPLRALKSKTVSIGAKGGIGARALYFARIVGLKFWKLNPCQMEGFKPFIWTKSLVFISNVSISLIDLVIKRTLRHKKIIKKQKKKK